MELFYEPIFITTIILSLHSLHRAKRMCTFNRLVILVIKATISLSVFGRDSNRSFLPHSQIGNNRKAHSLYDLTIYLCSYVVQFCFELIDVPHGAE